jgi:hypothetical protein
LIKGGFLLEKRVSGCSLGILQVKLAGNEIPQLDVSFVAAGGSPCLFIFEMSSEVELGQY